MIFNRRGQVFSALLIFILILLLFIFAAPIIFQFVAIGVGQTGTATGFIMRAFPWVMLFVIIFIGLRIITSGAEFF